MKFQVCQARKQGQNKKLSTASGDYGTGYDESGENWKQYPIDRAMQFHKEIKKLGQSGNGLSFLDEFRVLITEMGNALGLVRLVRVGGMKFASNATAFLQDASSFKDDTDKMKSGEELNRDHEDKQEKVSNITRIPNRCSNTSSFNSSISNAQDEDKAGKNDSKLEDARILSSSIVDSMAEAVTADGLSEYSLSAAEVVDRVKNQLRGNFSENTKYFTMLVEVFAHSLNSDENEHLKNFYLIAPAVIYNAVEAMMSNKVFFFKFLPLFSKQNSIHLVLMPFY